MTINTPLGRALIVFLALVVLAWLYLPGTSGALYYDDYSNLEGLADVRDAASAWDFATAGIAGPWGRPIALASFVPHAAGWPDNSLAILRVNVVIHLINAVLLGLLGLLLLRSDPARDRHTAFWVAFSAALLWASLPLLASTSLLAIQRMTSLAATFSILGLIGFVAAHRLLPSRALLAWAGAFSALGAGALLGMFTKETAALTPVLALILATLFLRDAPSRWRGSRDLVLLAALLFLLYYLSPLHRDWFSTTDFRGWSAWERLQTQAVILWEYLRLAVAPLPNAFSPFHDHYPILAGEPRVVWAALGWTGAMAVAIWLQLVRGIVWPLFALLWFLAGHLLESTTLPLELKFEHRNYLALWGLALALSVAAFSAKGGLRRLAPAMLGAFIVLQMSVLYATTILWGQPQRAAAVWLETNPGSGRAVIHQVLLDRALTGIDPADANFRFIERQRQMEALALLDRTARHCPDCLGVQLDAIILSCPLTAPEDTVRRLKALEQNAKDGKGRSTELRPAYDALFRLRDYVNAGSCPPLAAEDLRPLAEALAGNPYFAREHTLGRILFLSAALAEDAGDGDSRDAILRAAAERFPHALPVLQYQVYSAMREGRHAGALAAIRTRRETLSGDTGKLSLQMLDSLEREVLSDMRSLSD